jgi:hypothetical protein
MCRPHGSHMAKITWLLPRSASVSSPTHQRAVRRRAMLSAVRSQHCIEALIEEERALGRDKDLGVVCSSKPCCVPRCP